MRYSNHIAELNELSASEGIFTTAQAARLGIPRNSLSIATTSGRAERIVHGAYRLAGSPSHFTDELAAIWKLTSPSAFTWERMSDWDGIVVGGTTAASLLGIGDFYLSPYRIYAPRRINSRIPSVRFGVRSVDVNDITWLHGLPVTKMERTLVDLCADFEDLSLVEDASGDALEKGLDFARFDRLVSEAEARPGVREPMDELRKLMSRKQEGARVL